MMKIALPILRILLLLSCALGSACVKANINESEKSVRLLREFLPSADGFKSVRAECTTRHGPIRFSFTARTKREKDHYAQFYSEAAKVTLRMNHRLSNQLRSARGGGAFDSFEEGRVQFAKSGGGFQNVYIIGRNLLIDDQKRVFETETDLLETFRRLAVPPGT